MPLTFSVLISHLQNVSQHQLLLLGISKNKITVGYLRMAYFSIFHFVMTYVLLMWIESVNKNIHPAMKGSKNNNPYSKYLRSCFIYECFNFLIFIKKEDVSRGNITKKWGNTWIPKRKENWYIRLPKSRIRKTNLPFSYFSIKFFNALPIELQNGSKNPYPFKIGCISNFQISKKKGKMSWFVQNPSKLQFMIN